MKADHFRNKYFGSLGKGSFCKAIGVHQQQYKDYKDHTVVWKEGSNTVKIFSLRKEFIFNFATKEKKPEKYDHLEHQIKKAVLHGIADYLDEQEIFLTTQRKNK